MRIMIQSHIKITTVTLESFLILYSDITIKIDYLVIIYGSFRIKILLFIISSFCFDWNLLIL